VRLLTFTPAAVVDEQLERGETRFPQAHHNFDGQKAKLVGMQTEQRRGIARDEGREAARTDLPPPNVRVCYVQMRRGIEPTLEDVDPAQLVPARSHRTSN
jgi:hypothetical protein